MHSTNALEFSLQHSGYYYEMNQPEATNYASWKLDYYMINNQVAYCIETGVDEGEAMVEGNWENTHLPQEIKERMLLLAYYGYNYPGHESANYRAATQALLWETILGDNSKVTYSSERYGNGSIYNVDFEKSKIESLVKRHYDKPSFQGTTVTVQIGKQISLEDTNQVLSNFDVTFSKGVDVQIQDNTLKLTPMEEGELVLTFTKRKNYSSNYKIFYGDAVQNMLVVGNVDEVTFQVKIKAITGKISLSKYDFDTGKAQGNATLEGAVYAIYRKSDDAIMSYIRTDENGYVEAEGFYYDEYYLKEIEHSEGYLLDETTYFFDFHDTAHVHMHVPEKVVKGKIRVLKIDRETNLCQSPEGTTLQGAQYGVYDTTGRLVDTLTIGTNCMATSKWLPYGVYEVKEITPSLGYQLDETSYEVILHTEDIFEVVSKEKRGSGVIEITKLDYDTNMCQSRGEATLEGAKYGIYDQDGNLIEQVTINSTCKARSKELPYGTYEVREIQASKGYQLDESVYVVNIDSSEVKTILSKEKRIRGKIEILKKDKDLNQCIGSGQGTLKGAQYEIYDIDGILVETVTIGENCKAISKELPYGHYTVKESKASTGYLLDTSIYSVFIEEEEIVSMTSLETIIKNEITFFKQIEKTNEDTTIQFFPEEGVTFEIYDNENHLYRSVITNKDGLATLKLPYGRWRVHQKNTKEGYEKVDDFFISVNSIQDVGLFYTLVDKQRLVDLQIYKIDAETKSRIALLGTTFRILNLDTHKYISQSIDGRMYDSFETDATGKLATPLKLPIGNYKIEEIKAPSGYLINDQGVTFSIDFNDLEASTTENKNFIISFENVPIKGQFIIHKTGEVSFVEHSFLDIPLENVVFGIYAQDTIFLSDQQSVHYKKDELVDTIVTQKNGKGSSKLLPIGKYYVKEIETHQNYNLDTTVYSFEIKQMDAAIPIVYVYHTVKNQLKKGTLEIIKIDSEDGHALPNTKIQILTEGKEPIFTGITDEDGKILVSNLPQGSYYIKEIASSFGYMVCDEEIPFSIRTNEDFISLVMTNDKKKVLFTIDKKDDKGNALSGVIFGIYNRSGELITEVQTNIEGRITLQLPYGHYFYQELQGLSDFIIDETRYSFQIKTDEPILREVINQRITSKVTIHKINQDFLSLEGVEIGIYTEEGDFISTGYTDVFGNISFMLENGKYYYQEQSTLDMYLLDHQKYYFEVSGEDQEFTLMNQRERVSVPNTFKNRSFLPEIVLFVLLFIMLGGKCAKNKIYSSRI